MKFMVQCAYCGKTYIVDSDRRNADFLCVSCGGINGKNDIIKEIPTGEVQDSEEDRAWSIIKEFDLAEHEGTASAEEVAEYWNEFYEEQYPTEYTGRRKARLSARWTPLSIFISVVWLIFFVLWCIYS